MGLLDPIIQPIASITGLGGAIDGSDVPMPNTVNYTPEQQARLDRFANESKTPASDIQRSWTAGVNQVDMPTPHASPLDVGRMNAGVNAAISNKYKSLTSNSIGQLKSQYDQQSQLEEANRLQQGFSMLAAKRQVDIKNQIRLMEAQRAREQARASAIGSIFGAIGMAGGAYLGAMAGGGFGAVAGAQAGGKMGQGVGGAL